MSIKDNTTPVQTDYDLIIVGGAAAGLAAALYASRRALKTLVITKALGGQLSMTPSVENFPGTKEINGMDLMQNFLEHAQSAGAEITYETVSNLSKKDGVFYVQSTGGERTAQAVILAFGLTPRNLEVPGEEEYTGKGVTYCATCDAPLFKNKKTAVVGGTYEALDAALLLAKLNSKVTLIHDKSGYPSQKKMFAEVEANENITIRLHTTVLRVDGEMTVKSITLKNEEGSEEVLELDGVFVEKGHKIDSSWVGDLVDYERGGAIQINEVKETKTEGLYAAGDVTTQRDKQVVVSAGAGATAALSAYQYIQKKAGKPALLVDWDHSEEA